MTLFDHLHVPPFFFFSFFSCFSSQTFTFIENMQESYICKVLHVIVINFSFFFFFNSSQKKKKLRIPTHQISHFLNMKIFNLHFTWYIVYLLQNIHFVYLLFKFTLLVQSRLIKVLSNNNSNSNVNSVLFCLLDLKYLTNEVLGFLEEKFEPLN